MVIKKIDDLPADDLPADDLPVNGKTKKMKIDVNDAKHTCPNCQTVFDSLGEILEQGLPVSQLNIEVEPEKQIDNPLQFSLLENMMAKNDNN